MCLNQSIIDSLSFSLPPCFYGCAVSTSPLAEANKAKLTHLSLSLYSYLRLKVSYQRKIKKPSKLKGKLRLRGIPMPSALPYSCFFYLVLFLGSFSFGLAGDPYVFYDWTVSYITASPLGPKQKVLSPSISFLFACISFCFFPFWLYFLVLSWDVPSLVKFSSILCLSLGIWCLF